MFFSSSLLLFFSSSLLFSVSSLFLCALCGSSFFSVVHLFFHSPIAIPDMPETLTESEDSMKSTTLLSALLSLPVLAGAPDATQATNPFFQT